MINSEKKTTNNKTENKIITPQTLPIRLEDVNNDNEQLQNDNQIVPVSPTCIIASYVNDAVQIVQEEEKKIKIQQIKSSAS